ncbi:MAG: Uma2 family endonuclease [Cyanobacteria bacterium P01_H01_bin.121]
MVQTPLAPDILYPESDGKPMADNTEQYQWIVRLVFNLRLLLQDETAFVAGDLLWYPVQAKPGAVAVPSQAPDVMVVLGRPAGRRGSYRQWEEANLAPQVVFEIISPGNSPAEMSRKQRFYVEYGVLEGYFYDPDSHEFWGFSRNSVAEQPALITPLDLPWTSPCLAIRFVLFEDGLTVYYPDGEPFKDPEELGQERNQALAERNQAVEERNQAFTERDRAWAKLRELGIDPEQL